MGSPVLNLEYLYGSRRHTEGVIHKYMGPLNDKSWLECMLDPLWLSNDRMLAKRRGSSAT
jgi:hypothetical protein